jgi:hypothetical protein
MLPILSTANLHQKKSMSYSRPNRDNQWRWDTTQRMGITMQEENLAKEREEIAARVANFKATQQKFQREREEYFAVTLENAKGSGRPGWAKTFSS